MQGSTTSRPGGTSKFIIRRIVLILSFVCVYAIRKIFPGGSAAKVPVLTDTPLARIMAQLDAEAATGEQDARVGAAEV